MRAAAKLLSLGLLWTVAPSSAGAARAAGEPAPTPFVDETASPGAVQTHALPVAAGRYVRLRLERDEADVDLAVHDTAGTQVLRTGTLTFPPGPRALSLLTDSVPETYRLEVSVSSGGKPTR